MSSALAKKPEKNNQFYPQYIETPIGKIHSEELANILGISSNALEFRIINGWSGSQLLGLVNESSYDPYLAKEALNALSAATIKRINKTLKEME